MSTVRKNLDEILPMNEKRAKEIASLPDEEIDYSDIPPLDESFFKRTKRVIKGFTKKKLPSSN
ncbi:MAG: hypothetical protein WBA77_21015 [Microcoleaceae cyanobacterium]